MNDEGQIGNGDTGTCWFPRERLIRKSIIPRRTGKREVSAHGNDSKQEDKLRDQSTAMRAVKCAPAAPRRMGPGGRHGRGLPGGGSQRQPPDRGASAACYLEDKAKMALALCA